MAHTEKHFTASELIRDVVIGMSDGLTVPFALAAGLSGAIVSTHIIVIAGLAEIAAGSIAMGLGGFLAAKSDMEHYQSELAREHSEIKTVPEEEKKEVKHVLNHYGLSHEESETVVEALSKRPKAWVDFMMKFELGLEKPDPRRALISALTIGCSYMVAGMIPLAPYCFVSRMQSALLLSTLLTLLSLFLFGYLKGYFLGISAFRSALQTTLIGGLAASAAFFLARAIS
jgi:VIT1/CCC1 family predicted Fe2+/Mn2+ transporter